MAPKRLYRSSRERILGGVAGGIGDYFDIDPTLVRLAWILLAFAGGVGILGYLVAWIIIPEAPWRSRPPGEEREPGGRAAVGEQPTAAGTAGQGGEAGAASAAGNAVYEEGERHYRYGSNSGAWIFGAVLVGLGFLLLLRNLWPILWRIPFWPVILILVGALLLAGAFSHEHSHDRWERKGRK